MPDYLHRASPPYCTIEGANAEQDEDLKVEKSWLSSSLRCYLDNDLLDGKKVRAVYLWWGVSQ